MQRVTVHNKDISSICCVAAACDGAADSPSQIVMASSCKAGVVAVTVLGGSTWSVNTFRSKVPPLHTLFLLTTCLPFHSIPPSCFLQGGAGADQQKPWTAAALVTFPAPDKQLLLLYGGGAGELFCCRVQVLSSGGTDMRPSASSAVELRDRGHSRTVFAIRARAAVDDVQVVSAVQFSACCASAHNN